MDSPRVSEHDDRGTEKMWAWNYEIPGVTNKCIHDLFAEQVLAQPNAPAICAWDGKMSYSVLDNLSTTLAGYLVKIGVKPEDVVPLCFEKSMWTVVAMLAVLKAGGAFAPLDPDHPASRHKEILRQTSARVVLVSAQHSARWASSSCHVVTLSEASISQLTADDDLPNFSATPGNAAYILFTSGSTGIPKGVVLEHRAVSTSCLGHGRAFGITDQSRVLQFTSYTFDFCMAEIITTLLYGGCICVPSDRDRRSDLAKAINAMGANWALLTPSVAQLLNPSDVPTLKILVIGGEQVTSTDWNRWPTGVQLINGYGPTECCIVCAGYTTTQAFTTGTIGRAIASVSWVVDPENHHKLAPLGSVGELLVEGPILARGYLNDAEKTAAAFIEDPAWLMDGCQGYAGRHGRLYKTGDLVQYNDDGNLVCLGRKDSQVKLRGQRIELGEIEHHLRECLPEATQMAVEVILPSEESKHATLAAFVRLEQDYCHIPAVGILAGGNWKAQAVTLSDIVDALAERLPMHMIPTIFITLEVFPMTTSGKTDRKVLREIGASFTPQQLANVRTSRQGQKRQPTTPAERAMQQLWAGVLAIAPDSIGLDDSFFRLGGDSIAAMKLVGEARRADIQLTVADLFRNPRLDQLTAAATASTHASPVSIPQVEHVGPVAQSFAQGRLWFLEELHPGLTWYLMPLAVRIRGPLDLPALHSALLAVEHRHETLRTTFATVDGASVQVVQPFQAKDLNIIDIVPGDEQGLAEAVQQEQGTVFNLRTQPGWRVTVYRVGEHDHVLSIVMHHIISDGWSVDVLMRELAGFYSASVRGHDPLSQVQPLPVQYRDFSLWQRQQAQADEHQKQLSYWVEQLQTSRPAELLCDKPRPAALSGQAGVQSIEIAGPLYAKLQSFCQLHGVTQFVVLLAAFRTAHFRLTGQDDATIGTVNANRDRWEIKDMIGFFVNLQCLRITAGHGSFEELVQQVHEVTIGSHANADVPFDSIVSKLKSDRDLSRHPLVQLVFAVHAQQDLGQLNLEGVQTESLADAKTSRFDLEFHFYQQSDGLLGNILFSTDLYAPETIDNLLSVFQRVLEACLDDPQAPVASMPLLREDNYAKLDAMGLVRAEETAYPRDSSVVDLFREQAAACPSRVAVKDSVTEMTYAQLDTASDVLARWLARRSLAPETWWACILKANLAYLPFDVKIPRKRMEDILSSLPGHRIILVGVGAQPPSTELSNIELVGIREALDEQTKTKAGKHTLAVCSGPSATSLAYVMFTSGSTGMPKGVMAEHRGIVRLVRDNNLVQHLPDSPVMAHMANLAFDASTWEIYSTLLRGGTLVCIGAAMVLDAEAVLQMFREHCIRTAYMAPSLFRSYILQAPALFTGLDMLCVGGEAVHPADLVAAKQYLTGKFVNGYGPTENTTFSATFLISPEGQYANGIPIGRALSNSGAFVMDAKLQLVPLGVVGELVVTGDGLARGYTDPARNIDRFVSVEIGGKTVRAYRTGDYVRHRPTDGQLEFFGRMDGQVKIRGNRVELGEVEHALRSDKAVREAVAVLQQHDGSEARLAGFVTVHEDAEIADEQDVESWKSRHLYSIKQRLTELLEAQLPAYMVPQTITILDAMPVNQNGKADRKALEQQIGTQEGQSGLKRQPETEMQRTMQQLWAGVLAIAPDSIGLDDSFFRLGGDSIAAMKLVGEARRAGIQLTVADLFRNPRLDQLTAAATASTHASPVSIPQVEHVGPVAQSFAQGRLWFLEELHPGLTWYLMPLAVRIRGPLDLPALHSALLAVERRHETLRTTFATVDGASVQVVQPFQAKDLNIIDIVPGDEQGLTEAVQQEQGTVFNLRTQPGWRVTVYRVGEHDHVLSIVMHHIISDGWSVDVLMRELAGFYSASVRGHDPLSQVQPLPVQYRDFSLWQRQQAQADEHQKQLSYWVEQLQTSRPAELLCDKPRPAALSGQAGVQSIEIAGPLYAKLQSFCQLHGVTQFVVLLAAFRTAHFRLTGQDDATIGTVNANRDRWEIKDMIGFFVNCSVHEVTIASHANADVPFESIVSKLKSDRDLSRHPLLNLEGVQTESLADAKTSRFDLEFHFYQQSDGLLGNILFSTDLYAPETIDNLLSVFQRVLEACLDDPQAPVASMPLLREDNYAKLDAMGLVRAEETAYPRDSSVVDLFREQAAACPSRVAVKDSVTEMTYAQLDTASDVLARWLARRSLAPETLVGVFASRSCEAIVAFLGILKANLAYLPFDVKIPRKRMEDILFRFQATESIWFGVGAQPPSTELSNIELVGIREALDEQDQDQAASTLAVCSGPSATSLAYVMFTSGSTGMPKGVMAEHRGIVRLVRDNNLVQHSDRHTPKIHDAILFRSYILQAPALFTGLDMLCVGGEAVHPADLVAAKQYLTGKGSTQTAFPSAAPSATRAFVMDAKLQLVPLGVVGELVVTGDGLARGYTDPARNIDRFVSVEIGGKTVRAYRTGDYVRHRPTDGQLEFFGRMDGQVKIRGNRVELGEVEHALRSDKAVREAVAVLQQHDGSEARLAGFVTVHEDAETADEHVDDSNESQHVDVWEDKFDADIYSPIDNVQKENIGRDFVGWTSMYDGSDIDKAEMNEWLDDTIDTMLNGQRPGNVLEIGSGTGMILFNLGDGLQSYVGLDPSRKAVQFIAETAKSIPGLAGKIRMYKATAADVGRLEQPVAASLVVINSVVQYFPSLDYLFKTVQQLVELEGTRTLFFGDVRSYALHREFLATRAVHMAGDRATKADIRRMVADMERVERELLVDPAFFTALPSRLPGLVDHVEILPKKMKATNELSCYRYAAVVHLTPRDGQAAGSPRVSPAAAAWPLYLAYDSCEQHSLQQDHGQPMPCSLAGGAEGETSDSPDWLASVHQQTQDCRSLSAAELVELAQEADCRVEISWSRQHSQQGGLDAIFHRYQPLTGERVMFRFPTDHAERPLHSLSSKPLRQQFLQKTQQRLVEMLEAQLPTYMVPQTLTVLDAMPVNPNGKVDRKALEQQADTQSNHSGQKQQPSTPAERAMQQLFFRLGGDSIAAMKLVGEARRAGIQLTVADLFRNPRLDQLTAAATASTHASPVSIPQVEHVGPVAQSFAQGRLWFLEELHPGLTWYLMPLAVRIRGPLDLPALHSALLAVERRHETLRTTFATVDGASVQVVQPFQAKDLNIIDIVPGDEQGLTEAVHQSTTVFNLRTQPGWRVTVYRVGEHDHVLSIVMHHIISDGWSVDVLMRELAGFYSASVRGHDPLSQVQPLPVQYRDFSLWQRQQAQADEHQKQLSYWVEQLQTSRPAELLCDKPRPAALSGQAGVQSIEIAGPLYAKLQSFCQLHGVTQFVVLLAAFRTAHFRLTGQDDATIGTVNANRDRWEIKDMIGFFVSMQCLRITIGDDSFEQLVQQVNAVAVASHANADVPFESIVSKLKSDRDLSRHPLVQLLQRDSTWSFTFQQSTACGQLMFSTDLYAPETIDNLLSVFQRVLEACLDDPQAPVASMPLLREDNYAKLDAMGLVRAEETAYPRDSSVVDLFREQAAACPSRVAVKDSVTEMTYAQLDTASDVLARWLARRSLAPETLVGVFASRSCEAIVAFLGILKANLAYLPFDVKIPRKRMEDILSSLPGHRIILVGVGAQPPSTELSNIELVGIREALDEQTKTKAGKHTLAVCSGPSATSLAYVMFTSGSTGMPKGVMAEHRGIVRLVRDNNLVQHLPDSPVMAHMANLAFDASTWEIYSTLLRGGTLVCIGAAMVLDAEAVLQMFPVHPADLVAAKQYLTGKGAVRKRHSHRPRPQQLGAFVMDAKLQLVPLGVVGELVVTGDGLARGYTDPARNIDRFVSVEIGGKTVRAYRTGDYVRHRPTDGQLEFFGRMDGQVKIRGNRVELGEVEHALRSDKAVREAVAVLQQHDGSEARLAGFVTVHEDAEIADEQDVESRKSRHLYSIKQRLTELLEAQLPAYMVPQTITILDAMPVNQNGKADRKALEQQIGTQEGQSGLKRQPETEMQRTMQQLWAGVLAIAPDSIGLDDSFFRLGGDSIAAMKLVGEARRAGIQLTVADLFRNPRLDQLTAAATASTHASPVSIPQVEHVGPVAQSFAQGRLWFLEELHPGLTWYLMPLAVRIRGPLDLPALHSALLAVERRHETLRTTFATVDGASVQVVQPFQAKDLNIIDIVPGDEQGLTEAVHQDHSTPFDLRTQPGWRVTVYRVGEHDHVLSIVMHHIISDGWSVDVLMRELAGFYSASVRGHDPLSQVQPLPVQYRDFSLWQRQQAQADEHQKQLSYWVEQLQTSRPAELLCDKPRPAALSGQAGVQSIEIAGPLYAKLQSFCQLHGVTQFVVLLAAFRTAHFRLTGQDDATIGTVNANRDRWEIKDMIGFFVNMQLRKYGCFPCNADVPFESIVSKLKSDRDLSRHPLVQLVFAVHAQRPGQLKLEGMKTRVCRRLWGSVMFSTDLYAPETIDNLLSVFQRVLEACLDDPQAPVASMPLLREDNYAKLDAMGLVRAEETAYPRDSSVVDLFREQAAACPSRVAVKDSVTEMTYAQLDTASDVLARWLARRSLAPETLVGVFASRSCEAIVAFLGILKANLAYLPFDVKIPRKRMEDILSSLPGHRIILVGEALDEQTKTKAGKHTLAVCSGPSATSLAYVMFTSGSTGMPKGVMAEHRGIVRLVRDNNLVQHLPDSPVMAHMANLAFDASTWEIYSTLLRGGTLVCIGAAMVLDAEAVLQMFPIFCSPSTLHWA
ncbi:Non-ribosomal peptide synthetase [Pyrenophora teres f. teres]|uniref:Non-ribosomal peptide synthetase n=1 Tax=Pyrenophora teres f. teres TaxID=97479 RepID=A0A6S6W1L3_9PLEO|nr:Non-ribosomal peptide synthetase [Pyrenophora teres f. teres]